MPLRSIRFMTLLAALLVGVVGCGDRQTPLVQVNSEREANEILVALAEQEIGADKTVEVGRRSRTYSIIVEPAKLTAARRVLVANNLPRPEPSGFDQMLAQTSLIPTATDERARLMYAMAGELERTLEIIDSVIDARVHIILPEAQPLSTEAPPMPSAMVLIKYRGKANAASPGDIPDEIAEKKVQDLIRACLPALTASSTTAQSTMPNVAIVYTRGADIQSDKDKTAAAPAMKSTTAQASLQKSLFAALVVFLVIIVILSICLWQTQAKLKKHRLRPTLAR